MHPPACDTQTDDVRVVSFFVAFVWLPRHVVGIVHSL